MIKNKDMIIFILVTFIFSCAAFPNKNQTEPENPFRAKLLDKLSKKIECIGCEPSIEELLTFYRLRDEESFQIDEVDRVLPSRGWQNYFRTYFLYFPARLKNPWHTPGSRSLYGRGLRPGNYYSPYGYYGRNRYHGTRY